MLPTLCTVWNTLYDAEKNRFNEAVAVGPSTGMKPSAESMNKIAFKAYGSIIAVFTLSAALRINVNTLRRHQRYNRSALEKHLIKKREEKLKPP